MLPKSKVRYTPAAVDDMDEIFSYIANDNAAHAANMLEKLNIQIGKLTDFPTMGSVLSDEEYALIQHGYRFIVVQPYLIFYRFLKNEVIIHRILHSRRDYLRELFPI